MNDFTKEELEAILEALTIIDKDPSIKPDIYWGDDLPEKICAMIESYCEHENANSIHPGDSVLICNKCETILSHWCLRKATV